MTRKCRKCKKILSITKFIKRKGCRYGRAYICRPCANVYFRKWSKRNPEKIKNANLRSLFGISLLDYKNLLKKQNNSCAICQIPKNQFDKDLAVDHCRNTKKVRGLLCFDYNTGIGKLKDNTELLERALKYLQGKL